MSRHCTRRRRRHPVKDVAGGVVALIIIVIILVAVIGCGTTATVSPAAPASSTSAPASTPPATPAAAKTTGLAPGQQVTVTSSGFDDFAGTVEVTAVRVTTSPADPTFGQAPANGQFIIATIRATGTKGQFNVGEFDWYAKGSNGQHYDSTAGNAMFALSAGNTAGSLASSPTLNPGESATGEIAFDVPAGHGLIIYQPSAYTQGPVASWKY